MMGLYQKIRFWVIEVVFRKNNALKRPFGSNSVRLGQKYIPFGILKHYIQCFSQRQSIEFGCRFFYMKMVIFKKRYGVS